MTYTKPDAIRAMRAILDTLSPRDKKAALHDLLKSAHPTDEDQDERAKIIGALELGRDMDGAASILGIGRRQLQRRMRAVGFDPGEKKGRPRRNLELHAPTKTWRAPFRRGSLVSVTDEQEKAAIVAAINRAGGNIGEAARELNTPRRTLQRRMRRYGLAKGKKGRPAKRIPYGKRKRAYGTAAVLGAAVVAGAIVIAGKRQA
jgi:transcriptional regulator of acetoin/glycerol metabolism